jgi:uncharacterized membrane protein YhaH (DUF805 family)
MAFCWTGINAVGLLLLLGWGIRHRFAYQASQPAGEGHARAAEYKQLGVQYNTSPFSFEGGAGRRYFSLALLFYFFASFAVVALFLQAVPQGISLGAYLSRSAPLAVKFAWLALLLGLHWFHWACVVKRVRSTRRNPWGMAFTAPLPPLYLLQLIALARGKESVPAAAVSVENAKHE